MPCGKVRGGCEHAGCRFGFSFAKIFKIGLDIRAKQLYNSQRR